MSILLSRQTLLFCAILFLAVLYNGVLVEILNIGILKIISLREFTDEIQKAKFFSSVVCRGSNNTDRLCKFTNLCFAQNLKSFIFFNSLESLKIGVPDDRFSPALVDFSSVYDHNTQYFNYIDLPDSSIVNFNVSVFRGSYLIFKRFNPENLMHVFHDDLIPAFITLNEIEDQNQWDTVSFVFSDDRTPGPYYNLYENFLKNKPIYLNTVSSQSILCFEKSFIGLSKESLWYQYGFKELQGPIKKDMSRVYSGLVHFRNYFIKQFNLYATDYRNQSVLFTRKLNRKILNDDDIIKEITAVSHLETYQISLESHSVLEAIEEVIKSKFVIGMHGSLLILSMFLAPNSYIIEMFPYGINPNICTPYKSLAKVLDLKLHYFAWENKLEKNTITHPEYPAEYGGLSHLTNREQEIIMNSKVEPSLCCYNPKWLYRIYQDTVVDLISFSIVLRVAYQHSLKESNNTMNKLHPSEVQDLLCTHTANNILVSWDRPWNLNFVNVSNIDYELWYQIEESDVRAFIMKKTSFTIKDIVSQNIYIWVRCHADGKIGPFNYNPLICNKVSL